MLLLPRDNSYTTDEIGWLFIAVYHWLGFITISRHVNDDVDTSSAINRRRSSTGDDDDERMNFNVA